MSNFLVGHCLLIGKVETQPILVYLTALLLSMLAQNGLQGMMEYVRCRVSSHDSTAAFWIDDSLDRFSFAEFASRECAMMDDQLAGTLRVGDFEFQPIVRNESASVTDLSTTFPIERRAVEDHA